MTPLQNDPAAVSIVLIFFNSRAFLAEAIESVIAQTLDNWELILVDDGSSDGSKEIATSFAQTDPRIRYMTHPGHANRGRSASRNLGARNAKSACLAFIDSDDVWVPTKLDEQLALLRAHPDVGLVAGALEYWWSWDVTAARQDRVVLPGNVADRVIEPPSALVTFYPLGTTPAVGMDMMVRRDVFTRAGGFEDSFPGMYDDQTFLCKTYLDTPIYVSSRAWVKYRQHPDSCTASFAYGSRAYRRERATFLKWFAAYLATRDSGDPAVDAQLRTALRTQRMAPLQRALDQAKRFSPLRARRLYRRLKRSIRRA